jgi:hypothetical protein
VGHYVLSNPCSLALAPLDYHMFGPLTTTCVDEDLQVMIKVRKWCIRGFCHNLKPSLHMGSEGL